MRFGHHANSWGGVVGHPVGVTSIKDLFYLTPGDTLATLGEVADAGYDGVELFDGNLAEFADDLGTLRAGLDEQGFARTFFHPEMNASLTLEWHLQQYAWHSRHHVAHITALRRRERW